MDAVGEKKVDLAKVKEEALPENMRKMTPEQRKAYLAEQAAEPTKLQTEIRDLNAKRLAYVKAEMEKQGLSEGEALDAALRSAIRKQAQAKNFRFQK